jgi:hypothetical protein
MQLEEIVCKYDLVENRTIYFPIQNMPSLDSIAF